MISILKKYTFLQSDLFSAIRAGCLLLGVFCTTPGAWAQRDAQREARDHIQTTQAGVNARIEVLGNPWRAPSAIASSQSRILVYRTPDSAATGATSVFINGQYHTSLVPGGYSELCYAPGNVEVGARHMKAGNRPKDLMDAISALNLQGGQTHYLKVIEQGGRPVMQPVSAASAQQEAQGLRYQLHTISRVDRAQDCLEVPASAATPAAPKQIALATDALFGFDRSDESAMTSAGRRALNKLIQNLRSEYVQLENIHIVGHADPLGSPLVNNRLAEQRAQTVRDYLLSHGLQSVRITSEGRGAREPVVTHCGTQATRAAIDCNQPNRRVVVTLSDTQR